MQLLFAVDRKPLDADATRVANVRRKFDRVGENDSLSWIDEAHLIDLLHLALRRAIKAGAEQRECAQNRRVVVAFDGVMRLKIVLNIF